MYKMLEEKLGLDFTSPLGLPPELVEHRVVDMYCKSTHPNFQQTVVAAFASPQEKTSLRVVISTVAYGLGVNSTAVWQIIHWGSPEDVEDYVQVSGRAGHDGQPASVVLCCSKGLQISFSTLSNSLIFKVKMEKLKQWIKECLPTGLCRD